ncbi:MAG TPA: hypothetical protein VFT84_04655, partial [Gemmatimonadales bacterium]|nr:hypothetical protein [Gemmatimonadales bacterium]
MSSNPSRALPALADRSASAIRYVTRETVELELVPPPAARTEPTVTAIHGETRIDEYAWLRNREDPEVLAYLEAENRHTEAAMRGTEALQEQLYQEMRGRIKETDLSVPERRDGWLYYSRTEAGGQYPILCRRRDEPEAPEQILLDQNPLAAGHAYFRLGGFEPSPDGRLLAYSVDTSGSESFTLVIKDLETGELLPESVGHTAPSLAWANDSRTLYYVVLDESRRPCRLFRHAVRTDPATDRLVHYEEDEAFFLDVSETRSRRFLLLDLASHSTSEVRVADADDPEAEFRVVEPRRPGIEYSVSHHGDRFYIVTNDGAPNFRLVSAPVASPGRAHWTAVLPYRPAVKLDSVDAFRGHLAVWEREAGLRQVRILDLTAGAGSPAEHTVVFPEPVYTVWQHANPEF